MSQASPNGSREEPLGRIRTLLERWRTRGRRWESRPYYPAILDIAGRGALVVGAGKVGEGKIANLVAAGAKSVYEVGAFAGDLTRVLVAWAAQGE